MKASNSGLLCVFISIFAISTHVMAHDTTHIHPLITSNISNLIKSQDTTNKAYKELYVTDDITKQRIYWGTDYDPVGLSKQKTKQDKIEYLVKDRYEDSDGNDLYSSYNNVIDGVVNEDRPVTNVVNHFYQAESGISLTLLIVTPTAFGESGRVPFWTGID